MLMLVLIRKFIDIIILINDDLSITSIFMPNKILNIYFVIFVSKVNFENCVESDPVVILTIIRTRAYAHV